MARRAGTRNAYDLVRKLERDAAWRKREVVDLRGRVDGATGPWQETLIRSGVVLLYAHWEAFTRYATQLYADFVSEQLVTRPVAINQLSHHFLSLLLYRRYQAAQGDDVLRFVSVLKDYLANMAAGNAQLDLENIIARRGTVDEAEFALMCERLNIVNTEADNARIKVLGVKLVRHRHAVAHGRYMYEVSEPEYLDYTDVLIGALDALVAALVEAATQRTYLIQSAA